MNNIQYELSLLNTLGWEYDHGYIEEWMLFWRVSPSIIINDRTSINLSNFPTALEGEVKNINNWTMDLLIGWFDPCLELVQDDMGIFTDSYPYIDHRPITLVNSLYLPHL